MILDYKISKTWEPVVNNRLIEILGITYVEKIKKSAEKILYRDSDWEACDLFVEIASREQIRKSIMEALESNIIEVIAYHACRPTRIKDYYEKGIMPLSPEYAQKQFREYFSPFASQEDITKAIESVPLETRDNVTHVVLDDRKFVTSCGHYLIYGGEYQNCLAIHLPGSSERTRDILKKFGKATVFVCRLPFSYVTDLEYLASYMLADHFFRLAHNREDVYGIDYTITIDNTIPPESIIRHYFPEKIKDPYKHQAVWNDITMTYE